MQQGTLYFSDVHIGNFKDTFGPISESFRALAAYFREQAIRITKAVDLGDTYEHWVPHPDFAEVYANPNVIRLMRELYAALFQDGRPVVAACPGNHQVAVIDGRVTGSRAQENLERAAENLEAFLRRVFNHEPHARITVFSGIAEVERGVYAHHGYHLDLPEIVEAVLARLPQTLAPDEKIRRLNDSADLHVGNQERWQMYREKLWRPYHIAPTLMNQGHRIVSSHFKLSGLFNEDLKSPRPLAERLRNPLTRHMRLQYKLLNAISDQPGHHVMVAGHSHVAGIMGNALPGYAGHVVSLGSWDFNNDPVAGVRLDDGRFQLIQYGRDSGTWALRDEIFTRTALRCVPTDQPIANPRRTC